MFVALEHVPNLLTFLVFLSFEDLMQLFDDSQPVTLFQIEHGFQNLVREVRDYFDHFLEHLMLVSNKFPYQKLLRQVNLKIKQFQKY